MADLLMATVVPLAALLLFVGGYTLVIAGRPGRVVLPNAFDRLPWRWWQQRSPLFRTVAPFSLCLATGIVLGPVISHPSFIVRTAFAAVLVVPNIWAWHLTRLLRRARDGKA